MKKRLLCFGMLLCMVLILLPTTAFATETLVCICEGACTVGNMNAACPVCGAEGAIVENCGKYVEAGSKQTAVEKVQAMIDALPTVVELENADDETVDAVYVAVQDAYDALDELSTEELEQITGLDKLAALMEWFTGSVSTYEEDYYLIFDKNTGTIIGPNYTSITEVVIPERIDGVAVKSIGDGAFKNCIKLTSITIPSGVTSIKGSAFQGCTSLTSITIPSGVTSIGDVAFAGCSGLTSITIPDSVKSISSYAFWGCSSLTSITIPNSVTSIGSQAFCNCTSLISITIPNSVTSIGSQAFYNCSRLTSITIPSGVTSIGSQAFLGCSSLTSITIPSGVTSIGNYAFLGCSSLTSITIPSGVTSIGDYAFASCSSLTSVTIPNSVTRFGLSVFLDCVQLENIYYIGTEHEWNTKIEGVNNVPAGKVRYIAQGVTFTPPSNLIYDGKAKEATVTKTNEDYGDFTVKYYDQNGQVYTAGPVDAGTYTVKIDIAASSEYPAISGYEVGQFTIQKAQNSFATPLSIENWTCGDTRKNPTAAAQFGTPTYSYSTEENGTYTTDKPTNAGTYWVKAVVEGTMNYTGLENKIQFTILPKTYTVTYVPGSNGTGMVAAGSKTHGDDFTLSSVTFTRAGYKQTGWSTSEGGVKVYDLGGKYTKNENITLYPVWRENVKLTGEISMGTNKWTEFHDNIAFKLSFIGTQTVTITANDNSGDRVTIEYLLSDKELTEDELNAATFTRYTEAFSIRPYNQYVIYAKLTDISNNRAYINSDGIVLYSIAVSCTHTGGTATCKEKAKCEICGEPYGELDSTNHNLENIPAKDATAAETGNIEYWHCKDCENNFSDPDGKDTIELKDAVIAKLPPEIMEGMGQSVTAGEKKDLIFRSNAAFGDFIRAELDGKTMDEKNYTVNEGSTVVTLKAAYVAALSAGEHTIGIVSESGTAVTTFTVLAAAGNNAWDKTVLRLQATASKTAIKMKWEAVPGADGYVIYWNTCGSKAALKQIKVIKNRKTLTWTHKNLEKNSQNRYCVKAYKMIGGKKYFIKTSNQIHLVTQGGQYTNVKKLDPGVSSVTLKKGKSKALKVTPVYAERNKKPVYHMRPLTYTTSNKKVATVSSKGVIKAEGKGSCYIYVTAYSGVYTKVKVIVK